MLDLARRLDLPVILHNRQSGSELFALLSRRGPRENAGVLHSFTESSEYGRKALDLGFRISFSGMITFKNAQNIRDGFRSTLCSSRPTPPTWRPNLIGEGAASRRSS